MGVALPTVELAALIFGRARFKRERGWPKSGRGASIGECGWPNDGPASFQHEPRWPKRRRTASIDEYGWPIDGVPNAIVGCFGPDNEAPRHSVQTHLTRVSPADMARRLNSLTPDALPGGRSAPRGTAASRKKPKRKVNMSIQNLVNLTLTEAQIVAVDAALTTLETELAGLVALTQGDKRRMQRMGVKSESFSRQALQIISQNPQMIPANIPVGSALTDLKLLDQLRPILTRITRLCERGNDTDAALGNDIMTVALQAYGLLKLTGRSEGLEGLRRDLSGRFSRTRRAPKSTEAAETPPLPKAA
ncbi:MAG: hypothetical protein KDI60_14275 [Xanthomonadales bacterium]|nr:hypothetical protein [Xanthomonadales bacterium]